MHTEILILAGTVSSAIFALSINRGLKMRDDKRPLAELLWYAGGLVPLAGVCLYWASLGDQPVTAQRLILFILGAAIGGFGLLAAGEVLRPTGASAQGDGTPPITNNAPSINTFNQSGGQNTINMLPPRRPDGLYQADQMVGLVTAAKRTPNSKQMIFTNLRISSNVVDLSKPFEFQDMVVKCPLPTPRGMAAQTAVMIAGDISLATLSGSVAAQTNRGFH